MPSPALPDLLFFDKFFFDKFDFVRRYFLVFVVLVVFVVWLAFLEVTAAGLPAALQRWRWGSRRRSDMAEWKRSISH